MLLDTCFLIDLHRELKRQTPGPATHFLQEHATQAFSISSVTMTEFLEGFPDPREGEKLISFYTWLDLDPLAARTAATVRRQLRQTGQLIGDFDILIAATALAHDLPLVTHNSEHFRRIPNLDVRDYRIGM